jgi:hypothetical protein
MEGVQSWAMSSASWREHVRTCTIVGKTALISPLYNLEKTINITDTTHYFLLSSLAINRINYILVGNYMTKRRHITHERK